MNFSPFDDFRVSPVKEQPAELIGEREVWRTFSHMGFCYAGLKLVRLLLALAGLLIIRVFFPQFFENPNATFFYDSLPFYLIVIPIVTFFMKKLPQSVPIRQKIGVGKYLMLLSIACFFLVMGSMMGSTISAVIEGLTSRPPSTGGNELLGTTNVWLGLLFIGILAPIAEEFIFRKVLIDSMRRFGDAAAIVVSAVVFGALHGNFAQFFYAVALGLIFGYIYCRTGNFFLTVLPHMLLNSVNILMSSLVLPRIAPLYAQLDALAAAGAEGGEVEAILSFVERELPAFLVMGAYTVVLYGGAFLGLIFFLIHYRNIRLAPSRYFMAREDGSLPVPLKGEAFLRPALLNAGVAVLLAIVLYAFASSIL